MISVLGAGVGSLGIVPVSAAAQSPSGSGMAAQSPSQIFNVRQFGAVGDGKALDTGAINRAIDAAWQKGGGTVYLPSGDYLSYSIHLRSNITLQFETGTRLIGADSPAPGSSASSGFYDLPEPNTPWEDFQDFGHNHWHNSLIWGENLENIAILGPGLIWGRGLSHGRRRDGGPVAEQAGVGNKAIA